MVVYHSIVLRSDHAWSVGLCSGHHILIGNVCENVLLGGGQSGCLAYLKASHSNSGLEDLGTEENQREVMLRGRRSLFSFLK